MRKLIQTLTKPCRRLHLLALTIRPAVRLAKRRLFAFRDSPDWVVRFWAKTDPGYDLELAALVKEAKAELELRLLQRARDIKREIEAVIGLASPASPSDQTHS